MGKAPFQRRVALQRRKTVRRRNGAARVNNSEGYFSGDCEPSNTRRGARESKAALKANVLVLEVSGSFMKVPMSQRLKFEERSRRRKLSDGRYAKYRRCKTLREALRAGATPDDLYYDLKHGALTFVPCLRAKKVDGPLPFSEWPPGVRRPDPGRFRPFWLPDDWAWGVKTTCKTYLPAFIAPNKRLYYHRPVIEKIVQHQLGGVEGMQEHGATMIREHKFWSGKVVEFQPDERLFKILTKEERKHLPSIEELHFCVVSARRARERTGVRGIVNVQSQFLKSGASPTWYVDKESVADYKQLGLEHVAVGGKLTPARNLALRDAERLGKACVQVSDDISRWEYHKGELGKLKGFGGSEKLAKANEAVRSKDRVVVSPVAAARFLLAKMRAAEPRPRLGGVFPTGNAAMGLLCEATSDTGFILGDFFVHDRSPCRFDTGMSLKEDYDFTCSHLKRHGCVLRCNRLVIHVAHETNSGGAVSIRDAEGSKEQQNIAILKRKWPGVFRQHGTRGADQVVLRWSKRAKTA